MALSFRFHDAAMERELPPRRAGEISAMSPADADIESSRFTFRSRKNARYFKMPMSAEYTR